MTEWTEAKIKAAVIERLRGRLEKTSILSEFVFDNYARRADLAFVGHDFQVFEIKSALDRLDRLPDQIATYLEYSDKITVVAATRHVDHVLATTASSIEVWEVQSSGRLKTIRRGKKTKGPSKSALIDLMHNNELGMLLNRISGAPINRQRSDLIQEAEKLPMHLLRLETLSAIKSRFSRTTRNFWDLVECQSVDESHLFALSRFLPEKRRSKDEMEIRRKKIEIWASEQMRLISDDYFLDRLSRESGVGIFGPVPGRITALLRN